MTAEVALRVGMAAGKMFMSKRRAPPPGGDRQGHPALGLHDRAALVPGFTSVGMDVRLFGPLPTPGVAMMTRSCAPTWA
jgi:phosphoglucosamine mutase